MKKKSKIKKEISFTKAEATGNDFVILDLRVGATKKLWNKKLVENVCDRNFGIGADGVVLLSGPKDKKNSLSWKFYNADGSEAEMCGNASRCVGVYEKLVTKKRGPYKLETAAGVVILEPLGGNMVNCKLPSVEVLKKEIKIKGANRNWEGIYINSGVPHFVVETDTFTNRDELDDEALVLKNDKFFGASGTNVTFICRHEGSNFVVTHERGVNNFTLSCGTGAVAAARYLADKYKQKRGSRLELPGGSIEVNFTPGAELVGPARIVFVGKYEL
ncbi:MAG: hypothetical protein A4S09_14625 [Proteobacteria bacterium SG_bin7]|nr:MAG: hypothetical protein A4S09_14625 [Proteobacteria bacterium SG_bin7]